MERNPIAELEFEYQRWDFYMQGGGSDPFYSDGYNMEQAIAEDDFISMRQKCNFEHYLLSQRAAEPQLSLFSDSAPQADAIFL